jgi:hypothetical protein
MSPPFAVVASSGSVTRKTRIEASSPRSASSFVRFGRGACVFLAVLTASTSACTPAPPPVVAGPRGSAVGTPKEIVPPEGVTLEATCVSTGPELCFDGIDNNCNGLLEEGCGIRSGDLQFVAAWSEAEADVDLLVTDPSGEVAKVEGGPTAGGLQKDRECPGSDRRCRGQNLENVVLAEGIEPKAGIYRVVLRLDSTHGATLPIKVRVGARMGAKVYGLSVELTKPEEEKTIVFRLLPFEDRRQLAAVGELADRLRQILHFPIHRGRLLSIALRDGGSLAGSLGPRSMFRGIR